MARQIYGYPALGRYGLAHGLLAWARCAVWCEKTGARPLAPIWLRPRIGPYLRRERDKRDYFKLFGTGGALGEPLRSWLLATARRIDVGIDWPDPLPPADRATVVVFRNALADNEKKCFDQVRGHGAMLRERLLAMTRPRYRPPSPATPFIAIHVRLGDFALADPVTLATGGNNLRLPIDWYGDRLKALRAAIDEDLPGVVFSDGSAAQLAPLLAMPGVSRAPRRSAVTDLLAIGQGAAVIASASGFSLWGAFLGDAPRIHHPGQAIVPLHDDPSRDLGSAFGTTVTPDFAAHVFARQQM